MNQLLSLLVIFSLLPACTGLSSPNLPAEKFVSSHEDISENKVEEIVLPPGFSRPVLASSGFGTWLRKLHLKKDKAVYLYNGKKKSNQVAQYAVLDVSVGEEDLQQCADAVMRLRAEYLFSQGNYSSISFRASDGTLLSFSQWRNGIRYQLQGNKLISRQTRAVCTDLRRCFDTYLRLVFSYCGTASLQKSLHKVADIRDIKPGDVWIQGGYPGHAMIVMDVVVNDRNEKRFLLAQSYMPAQDIHIVRNPAADSNPWYEVKEGQPLHTPEWTFPVGSLYRW